VVAQSSDPRQEGAFSPGGDPSEPILAEPILTEPIPAIEHICRLSPASKMVQASRAGADDGEDSATHAHSPQRIFRTYPIFDRDGKVARMIGVDAPAHQARPHETSPCGCGVAPDGASAPQGAVSFCGMVGASRQMTALFRLIRLVSSSKATILIYGESGTGKELVARAIHHCSARRHRPFIPVDCGALSETLLESELFGHVKGAFTGAIQQKKGLFEEAEGGTLFLDEIGDTSTAFQSKLLRALQEGEIRSVGGTRSVKINVRVVAATNTRLKEAIARKKFREDLYYRLAVMPITIPPLRERPDDILPLARHFIRKYAGQNGKGEMHLSQDAADLLCRLPWRGNIRELENVIERATLISPGTLITAESLLMEEEVTAPVERSSTSCGCSSHSDSPAVPFAVAIDRIRSRAERERIVDAMRRHRGNKTLAARSLGIARSSLYNKLKRYRIDAHDSADPCP
jgi:two-component system response regulator HydG